MVNDAEKELIQGRKGKFNTSLNKLDMFTPVTRNDVEARLLPAISIIYLLKKGSEREQNVVGIIVQTRFDSLSCGETGLGRMAG